MLVLRLFKDKYSEYYVCVCEFGFTFPPCKTSRFSDRARGIKLRKEEGEAVAGYFSNIGDGNVAHHIWGESPLATGERISDDGNEK